MIAYRCRFTFAVLSALCLLQGNPITAVTGRVFLPKAEHIANQKCQEFIDKNTHKAYVGPLVKPTVYEISAPNCSIFRCGRSLISERFVLTAAHCGKPKVVMLGEHNTLEPGDEVEFYVETFIKHPKHRLGKSYHDIALVKLSEDIEFSNVIRPACLWTTIPLNLTRAIATGFGDTEYCKLSCG
ncbi:serine protease snake-like [Wyeomyia smithii]|uniref:serine protease snake-like n=1 Tax=Wyeomyia smithii TaxID=174621 RepID=UPI0024680DC4|nr:serine protease snake-like [Wyeomyia smithii]